MRSSLTLPAQPPWPGRDPMVDVVIPVSPEVADLESSVRRLRAFLDGDGVPYRCRITIADHAGTDGTWAVAVRLATELSDVVAVRLPTTGRGGALRTVWSASDAQILAYLDVDLSLDLAAFLPLISAVVSGHSDLAIGTRPARGARVTRGPKREFISRTYTLILRSALRVTFSDAQRGFTAITADAADQLLPLVEDTGSFFDTELLVLAERAGLRIYEVPVDRRAAPAFPSVGASLSATPAAA